MTSRIGMMVAAIAILVSSAASAADYAPIDCTKAKSPA
jgi:hypothetical protein